MRNDTSYSSSSSGPTAADIARNGCNAYGGCLDDRKCIKQGYCTRVYEAPKR